MNTAFLPGLNRLPSDLPGYDANKKGIDRPAKTRGQRKLTTISIDPVTNTGTIKMPVEEIENLLFLAAEGARHYEKKKSQQKYLALWGRFVRLRYFGKRQFPACDKY